MIADKEITVDASGHINLKGADFFEAIARTKRFINLGDTNHSDPAIYETIAGHMDRFAKAGVKHVFLEIPKEGQLYIDDMLKGGRHYCSNKKGERIRVGPSVNFCPYDGSPPVREYDENFVSPDEIRGYFAKQHPFLHVTPADQHRPPQALADIVIQAKKYGMKVHFADNQKPLSEVIAANPKMSAHYMKILEQGLDRIQDYLETQLTIEEQLEFAEYMEKCSKARDVINPELAAFIKKKAVNERGEPEKAMIIYGYGHSYSAKDLDEFLGKNQTVTIAIYASPQFHDTFLGQVLDGETSDRDHYRFYINSGAAVKVAPHSKEGCFKWLRGLWKSVEGRYGENITRSGIPVASVGREEIGHLSPHTSDRCYPPSGTDRPL